MASLSWKPLPPFSKSGVPTLLVSPVFTESSYTLRVTDLANVWVEELDRREIRKRSLNEDTSIDASEGADQLAILLGKLKAALDSNAPDHNQTNLKLASKGSQDLVLLITCLLPGGLRPLEWPVYLTKCPFPSVATHLVLPLIEAQHSRAHEIDSLISRLKEKNAIINKLVDKLEAAGTGLENVFDVFSGKRKVTREMADEKIKGLASFNEQEWKSEVSRNIEAPKDVSSLVNNVFGVSEPMYAAGLGLEVTGELSGWWAKLGSDPVHAVKPEEQNQASKGSPDPPLKISRASTDEDDDFQVQSTPPRLAASRKRRGDTSTKVRDDMSTDDDGPSIIPDSYPLPHESHHLKSNDPAKNGGSSVTVSGGGTWKQKAADSDDTASESDKEPVKISPKKKPAARLGTIGKRTHSTASPAKAATPEPERRRKEKMDDDATASETDDETFPRVKSPESPKEALPQRKKGGLGRIGGKSNNAAIPRNVTKSPSPGVSSSTTADVKPAGRKLGVIGKKKQEDERPADETPAEQPEAVETEEQKAERKRADLARELERKATAGPAKKKRKF